MNTITISIAILFSVNGLGVNAMQQQCTITDMPQAVIRHIAGFLTEYHSVAAFGLDKPNLDAFAGACRYLHASVTRENRTVVIQCEKKRGTLPVNQFLDQVFTCIQHIVARQGANPIELHLSTNRLSDDMNSASTFLARCSQTPIVQYVENVSLGDNQLTFLPREIGGLVHLKYLGLGCNKLEKKDLYLLKKIIDESLTELQLVDVSFNGSLSLRDIFQTITRCATLRDIMAYGVGGNNRDFIPTAEEIKSFKIRHIGGDLMPQYCDKQ